MINKEILEKAKQTSFLAYLTDKDIICLLNECGYKLDINIESKSDGARKPITRRYDSRNRKIIIEVCAINEFSEQIMNALAFKMPLLLNSALRQYNTSFIVIKDFEIINFMSIEQNASELQNKFAQFMYKKFGERYRIRYNKWVARNNKKLDKQNGAEK